MILCDLEYIFCFKQKSAYEMRISDWSSDVCSSDLGESPASDQGSLKIAARPGGDPIRLGRLAGCLPIRARGRPLGGLCNGPGPAIIRLSVRCALDRLADDHAPRDFITRSTLASECVQFAPGHRFSRFQTRKRLG